MKRVSLGLVFASLLFGGCADGGETVFTPVYWMEWPAEAPRSFTVRLTTYVPCMADPEFRPGVSVSQGRVTFEPYFVGDQDVVCADRAVEVTQILTIIDTTGETPVLTPRAYEMWGAAVYNMENTGSPYDPVPFGDVLVTSSPDPDRVNAGGTAVLTMIQGSTCLHVLRAGVGLPAVVENPPAVILPATGVARGYFHTVATPICGQTRVFHLDSFSPPYD